ncbi:hypothetical protein [Acuticoccus sediminis]|uniref:hypothetical protein n=1 Tax=Acuticoccus sediminis TaxID=2184697 RepID=UPI001CFDE4A0|nr:hypothetical protein [Acuticoccus sediminis]
MDGALRSIALHAPLVMVGAVVLGLALPSLASLLSPMVVPLATLLIVISMMRVDPHALRLAFRRPGHIALASVVLLVLMPAITLAIAIALGLPTWLATGLTLIAAAPPLSSAAAFAVLVRIDPALVTALSIPATLVSPLTVWSVTSVLPGLERGLDVTALSLRLGILVATAFGLALIARRLFGRARIERSAPAIDASSVILIGIIGIGLTYDIGIALRLDAFEWFAILAATSILSFGSCAATLAIFWRAGRDRAVAASLAAAVRNIAPMMAAIFGVVEPRIYLVVVTAQIPSFAAPLFMRPLFQRLGRMRGPA